MILFLIIFPLFFFLGGGGLFLKKNNTLTTSPIPLPNPNPPNPNPNPTPRPNPSGDFFFILHSPGFEQQTSDFEVYLHTTTPHKQSLQVCSYLLIWQVIGPRLTLPLWHKLNWFEKKWTSLKNIELV